MLATGDKLAYTIREISEIAPVCRSAIYKEINGGRLLVRKLGGRTLVLDRDLRAWLDAIPMKPK